MADGGELRAFFKGAQEDAAQAVESAAGKMAGFGDETAQNVRDSVSTLGNAEDANTEAINGIRGEPGNLPETGSGTGGGSEGGSGIPNPIVRILSSEDPLYVEQGTVMFSSGSTMSNAEVLESGAGLPRIPATVTDVASRAGVDLEGSTVRIIEDPEYIRYLDYQDACACAPYESPGEIHLGPASFADEETLAATLAHEQTHVLQYAAGYSPNSGDLEAMEAAARAAEPPAVARLLGEKP